MHASPEAIAIFERQQKYDVLHHRMRLQWLRSLPRLDDLQDRLLKQSEFGVNNPFHIYNSVDVDDEAYLAELDEFDRNNPTQ